MPKGPYLNARDYRIMVKSDERMKSATPRYKQIKESKRKPMTVLEMYELKRKQRLEQWKQANANRAPVKSNTERAKEIIIAKKSGEIMCERLIEKDNTTYYRFSEFCLITQDQWDQIKQDLDLTILEGDERWQDRLRIQDIVKF